MKTKLSTHRALVAVLATATALGTFAPAANAGRWDWRHHERGHAWGGRPVMMVRAHEHGAGLVAGLIGGFVLGAAMTQSHPVVVHERTYEPAPVVVRDRYYEPAPVVVRDRYYEPAPVASEPREHYTAPAPAAQYRYEDAYSDRWWDTLEECRDPAYGSDLPRVIRVVDAETNRVVRTMIWKHDHWIADDDGDN